MHTGQGNENGRGSGASTIDDVAKSWTLKETPIQRKLPAAFLSPRMSQISRYFEPTRIFSPRKTITIRREED